MSAVLPPAAAAAAAATSRPTHPQPLNQPTLTTHRPTLSSRPMKKEGWWTSGRAILRRKALYMPSHTIWGEEGMREEAGLARMWQGSQDAAGTGALGLQG